MAGPAALGRPTDAKIDYLCLVLCIKMHVLPIELKILIFSYACPVQDVCLNRHYVKIYRCNFIWGPIVWKRFKVGTSPNYFEEFKWQLKLAKHRRRYQMQWTLGCVGKVHSLGPRPEWSPAYTTWAPPRLVCST